MIKNIEWYPWYLVSDTGEIISKKTNSPLKSRTTNSWYSLIHLKSNWIRKAFTIHRLVAIAFIDNLDKKKCVDHIDNNIQNNNLINLRWATKSQNSQNRSMSTRNTSGVKGVSWNKNTNKWRADICINGKSIHLGSFLNKDDAINIRVQRAKDEFGQYLNKCELVINV